MDGVCFDKICFETTGVHRGGLLHRFLLDVLPVQPDSVRSCSDPDIFISRSNELAEQLRAAKQKKERLLDAGSDEIITQTQELLDILDAGPDFLECFDEELFCELVDKIIVESNERLWFRLKNGLELPEAIERTVR